jgi:hypothetical protein
MLLFTRQNDLLIKEIYEERQKFGEFHTVSIHLLKKEDTFCEYSRIISETFYFMF